MHAHLLEVQKASGLHLANLAAAAGRAVSVQQEARQRIAERVGEAGDCFDVFAFGSLAREELTAESDFDYIVVAFSLPDDPSKTKLFLRAADETREKLDLGRPGGTGMFGRVISAPDLTERIGLEQDTNQSHSLRILMLQESVSIYLPEMRQRLLAAILKRYLRDYPDHQKLQGVPRFLLNDIVRYWRTIAVDYQAKRWNDLGVNAREQKWGLRYLKLRLTRKLAFASTLAAVLINPAQNLPTNVDSLTDQFSLPALARLAQLHPHLEADAQKALGETLAIADAFCGVLGQDDFRQEVSQIESLAKTSDRFDAWRSEGDKLQMALERIFLESKLFGTLARRYLVF